MSELDQKIGKFERAGWVLHYTNGVDAAELRPPMKNDGSFAVFIDGLKIEVVKRTERGTKYLNISRTVPNPARAGQLLDMYGQIDPDTVQRDAKVAALFEFITTKLHCIYCGSKPVYREAENTKLHQYPAHICPTCGGMFMLLAHSNHPSSLDDHVLLQEAREHHGY